ncbi:hypothetical protein WJX73_006520 [Symbiochloris irregularis]|uniref:RRM domain-containing protein n=1 Tax=Symbiochloris irregularis TaxID=706552 RepID=A0AAW1PQ98_9CHLO
MAIELQGSPHHPSSFASFFANPSRGNNSFTADFASHLQPDLQQASQDRTAPQLADRSAARDAPFSQGRTMQLGQAPYGDLQDSNLAAQFQHQLRLREEQGAAVGRSYPQSQQLTESAPDHLATNRSGSGGMAGGFGSLVHGSDPNMARWADAQGAGNSHPGLPRNHSSHEDVFSAVGGLELNNRHPSARDLPGETSQAGYADGYTDGQYNSRGLINAASSGSLSGLGQPLGPGVPRSASTASLQGFAAAMGEPPPCRTIYVRNLSPEVDDAELQAMFEKCGDIRTLYSACKHQGFVLISYYDGRAGNYAKAALDGMPLNGQPLQIEPSVPGQKVHDKDTQSATVSVFGVNEGMSDQEFRSYMVDLAGDVASVSRSTTMPNCRLAEFWDVRAAHYALARLTGSQARVPTINEGPPSQLPMGLRNVQSSHVLQNAMQSNHAGPPPADDGGSFRPSSWDNTVSPLIEASLRRGNSADLLAGVLRQPGGAELLRQELLRSGSSSALQALQAAQAAAGAIDHSGSSGSLSNMSAGPVGHSASQPNLVHNLGGSPSRQDSADVGGSPRMLGAVRDYSAPHLPQQAWQGAPGNLPQRGTSLSTGDLNALYDTAGQLGPPQHPSLRGVGSTGSMWAASPMGGAGGGAATQPWMVGGQQQGGTNASAAAEAGAAWGALQGTEAAMRAQMALGMLGASAGTAQANNNALDAVAYQNAAAQRMGIAPSYLRPGSGLGPEAQALLQQQLAAGVPPRQPGAFLSQQWGGGGRLGGVRAMAGGAGSYGRGGGGRGIREDLPSGGRPGRRSTDPVAEAERKAQQEKMYSLDYEKVLAGEDRRTTIMLKNIPNKYTQKMLLATIDEDFRGSYDFFYLPIDFKNKCNVGYAFLNLLKPETIVPLAQRFNRKKWERFNSEKVCHITYARIQGKHALVTHFQNSSLLHEDKRCRPILFKSDGVSAGDQDAFPPAATSRGGAHTSASSSSGSLKDSASAGQPQGASTPEEASREAARKLSHSGSGASLPPVAPTHAPSS